MTKKEWENANELVLAASCENNTVKTAKSLTVASN